MRLVVATGNMDKVREFGEVLRDTDFEPVCMKELGIDPEIIENGKTFEENALIKARAVHKLCGDYVCADDSGLCIDGLDGAPGIYSARFCGEDSTYEEKFAKIFSMLKERNIAPGDFTARFVCAIAVVRPDGSEFTVRGEVEGLLIETPRGSNGFGYDPIFYIPERGITTAEMDPDEKNRISHRGKALRAMVEKLTE